MKPKIHIGDWFRLTTMIEKNLYNYKNYRVEEINEQGWIKVALFENRTEGEPDGLYWFRQDRPLFTNPNNRFYPSNDREKMK